MFSQPNRSGESPKGSGSVPNRSDKPPESYGDIPNRSGKPPKGSGSVPNRSGKPPESCGGIPNRSGCFDGKDNKINRNVGRISKIKRIKDKIPPVSNHHHSVRNDTDGHMCRKAPETFCVAANLHYLCPQ